MLLCQPDGRPDGVLHRPSLSHAAKLQRHYYFAHAIAHGIGIAHSIDIAHSVDIAHAIGIGIARGIAIAHGIAIALAHGIAIDIAQHEVITAATEEAAVISDFNSIGARASQRYRSPWPAKFR
jgi:hypothetical protein